VLDDPMTPALAFEGVSKAYPSAGGPRLALRDLSFTLPRGRRIAIVGRSGSGKSTLLHLAAGIDLPTAGVVRVDGEDLGALSDGARTRLRRDRIGLVFQFFHLLSHLSVFDNVALPEWIAGARPARVEARVHELLERVGLADRAADPADALSGGEMQRVAICRALVRRPRLLLADEPTGNLDDASGRQVMDLLLELAADLGHTLVLATHSRELAALADETWRLSSGALERP
jgi:putative ABC transport system ATP-binding protein